MPELPEVETVRRGLNNLIVGYVIKKVDHDNPKSFPNLPVDVKKFMIGADVIGVRRRAKVLMIDLSSGYSLVIHLKMTGQLVYTKSETKSPLSSGYTLRVATPSRGVRLASKGTAPEPKGAIISAGDIAEEVRFGAGHPSDSLVGRLPDKSTRVTVEFKDGSHLYFNDQRKFGWMRLIPTVEVENIDFMKKVGPEPLEDNFTAEQFTRRFTRRPGTTIKAALLDQSVIAGVGNIYADESLWKAKIHPARKVSTIKPAEFKKLYEAVRYTMKLSIEKGGSTDRNYVDAEGKKGSYLSFAKVFRREGRACERCGGEIVKIKVAGRGTHICPKCQRL